MNGDAGAVGRWVAALRKIAGETSRERLGERDAATFQLRWEIDGYRFIAVRVEREQSDRRYVWLDDEGEPRRVIRGMVELEELIKRQLLEPGGETLFLHWGNEPTPSLTFRAMIAAGDRLRCVVEPSS